MLTFGQEVERLTVFVIEVDDDASIQVDGGDGTVTWLNLNANGRGG